MTGSGFSNVELPDPAKRGAKSTRKGKKSVAWQDDPEILKRLALVAELMLDGCGKRGIGTKRSRRF